MIAPLHGERPSPLARALRQLAAAHGIAWTVRREEERPWATATFVGRRHRIELDVPANDHRFAAWLAALPERDVPLRRAFIADLTVEPPATVVALVIDD